MFHPSTVVGTMTLVSDSPGSYPISPGTKVEDIT